MEQGASSIPSMDDVITDLTESVRLLQTLTKKPYACVVCKIKFAKVSELLNHEQIHPMRIFRCDECKITCQSRTAYMEHLHKIHARVSQFKCPYCFKIYGRYRNYSNHLEKHVDFECRICHKKFFQRRSVYKHIAIEHLDRIGGKLEDIGSYIKKNEYTNSGTS